MRIAALASEACHRGCRRDVGKTIKELDPSIPVVLMHSMMVHTLNPRQRAELFRGMREATRDWRVARISFELSAGEASLGLATDDILPPTTVGRAKMDARWMSWEG